MTFEQLAVFVAVAERQHITQAAEALHLTPSAVSASVKALEIAHGVRLFERVGRGIELTREGRFFLKEARETLARMREAERMLTDLADVKRGRVDLQASQTIGNYWLPPRLVRFHADYPKVEVVFSVGNSRSVADAVLDGAVEIGLIEGSLDEPALSQRRVATDHLMVVAPFGRIAKSAETTTPELIRSLPWILREEGSGTRSEFEAALAGMSIASADLNVVLSLPSNEAVLSAAMAAGAATVVSRLVAEPMLESGLLVALDVPLPPRHFMLLRHKERHLSSAAQRLIACFDG
ncbi:LysR family transcriptional regulator [Rhizobium paknamense]|uniref:DNA-binding transcriptional LysR family regulator n=1 Tax=Rhizobium paknamense TaxID=1206817 RepID=A0ABU0IC98_9HYPH|nr:LysR family transcriptional regulator [Rhizobium paknamense]MDQ0455851.1 DNA-binding transcriptional LysR family regulator [Rhizobium paknamense]